jgi:peptidoglycan/LPS O-acetylase OafA/YrhL
MGVPAEARGLAFRPDIEGLRAIAVLVVVLQHGGVTQMPGGYVGVDVFFVLSGFLITGLLLRDHERLGRVNLPEFYARRVRRILPACTLVLVATVAAAFLLLGTNRAVRVAADGQWSAIFAGNIRQIEVGSNYLSARLPPSPLQHLWSLAVEEQFYLVWPALFSLALLATGRAGRLRWAGAAGRAGYADASRTPGVHTPRPRVSLACVLVSVIAASLVWSVWQTAQEETVAYFSPLTRAWELAAGALLAVCTPVLLRAPTRLGLAASGLGFVAIVSAVLAFDSDTPVPGYAMTLPVVGTFLVIAGGTIAPARGLEHVLASRVLQWIGKRSYAWYLWHWPVLVIAAAWAGHPLTVLENTGLLLLALCAAAIAFAFVEHPIHRSARLQAYSPWLSVTVGAVVVLASFGTMSVLIAQR